MTHSADLMIIDHLLRHATAPAESISEFKAWKKAWKSLDPKWETPIDRSLAGGLAADRPAWAFAAGYQGAIESLARAFAIDEIDGISAFCVTEKDGAHPSRITSRLMPITEKPGYWRLDGHKTFITGAEEADTLWVAAATGKTADGRNRLRMAVVPARTEGITLSPMPPLGLVPEMPHAEVAFKSVVIPDDALIPGDGYLNAVKPFRTLEDLHITAAFLAWISGVGRRAEWPCKILETILALVISARGLALAPPLAFHAHIPLGGLLGQMHQLLTEIEPLWKSAHPYAWECWRRDRKILNIAESARRMRLERAWQHYPPRPHAHLCGWDNH